MNALLAPLRRVRRRGRDAGLTLVELLAVMVCGSIVLGTASAIFIATTQVARGDQTRENNAMDAGNAVEAMAKVLRQATPRCVEDDADAVCQPGGGAVVAGATGTDVTLFSAVGNRHATDSTGKETGALLPGPYKVRLYVSAGTLYEDLFTPSSTVVPGGTTCCSYPATPAVHRVLARGIVNNATQPVFSYSLTTGGTATVPIAATDVPDVAGVTIDLRVGQTTSPPVAPTQVTDVVYFLNTSST